MFYMPSGTDIAGYAWQADKYCPDCMRGIAIANAYAAGSAMVWGDCGSAEDALGEWGSLIGVDYRTSRDTEEFPVPIFVSESGGDTCGGHGCHEVI